MSGKRSLALLIFSFISFTVITSLNACILQPNVETRQYMDAIRQYNKEGLDLLNNDSGEDALASFLKSQEYAEKLVKDTDSSYEKTLAGKLLGETLNNISSAYYYLDDYESSLEYAQKAIDNKADPEASFINKGNALAGLNRYEEALESYDLALNYNIASKGACYGKGMLLYDYGYYQEALAMFDRYINVGGKENDAALYRIYCLFYSGDKEEALTCCDKAIQSDYDNFDLYKAKGEILNSSDNYDKAQEFFIYVSNHFRSYDAQMLLGEFYYNNGKYQEALEVYHAYSRAHPDYADVQRRIIYCYEGLGEIDTALAYCDKLISEGYESAQMYNAAGNVMLNQYRYMDSVRYFDGAIRLEPEDQEAYINELYALYNGKRYSKCIQFGNAAEAKFSTAYDIPMYVGESCGYLGDYEAAIKQYNRALELYPDSEAILADTAYAYLMVEDFTNAEKYMKQCLELNPDNSTAQYVSDTLTLKQKPINVQVKEFIENNYLYYDEAMDAKLDTLLNTEGISNKEIAEAFEEIRAPEDLFSFILYDDEYDWYMAYNENDVEYSRYNNIDYIKIKGFNTNTDSRVIELLDKIEDTENETLVLDLRDNPGGLTQCANNILDVLLPDCVSCTLIDRQGYTYSYYSDQSYIKFNKIYVLVNGYSASSSEILTLGLKTYLDNVTILGSSTFGKGVGQMVFEDKKRKLLFYLVDSYWNVRQENITGSRITPDITLESDNLEDYIDFVKAEEQSD